MKISLNWLKEYVEIPWSVPELAERLTGAGLEVEGVTDQAETFRGFVVGNVVGWRKHPKADRLSVCIVDVGREKLQIVCGAPNVAEGQKVAVGLVGATVPHDQHDPDGKPFVLGSVTLRGVQSHGMICSEKELGLGEDGDEILVLDPAAQTGVPLAEYLSADDVILDIAITPNRADCLSHVGVARDIAALTGRRISIPASRIAETTPAARSIASLSIEDPDLCPRYAARVLSGISLQPSPEWMQTRLRAVGMRPLNIVVDVTNYVMLELGQPLHAFDLDTVEGEKIVVRRAGKDEAFTTLDGKERRLTKDTLMICDAVRPIAVAGVMGGLNSEIGPSTTRVLLESATFAPSGIRKTARSFGLSTEASYRFERGVDPELPVRAADRAAALLQSLCGAVVHKGTLDAYPGKRKRKPIRLRVQRTNEILGTAIPAGAMKKYLQRLGCTVGTAASGVYPVTAPSYRVDISQEIDLVEEVARVHGYDNIETLTKAAIDFSVRATVEKPGDVIRSIMTGFGYNEIRTLSLQKESTARLVSDKPVRVLNPVSTEMQTLRPSLVPGALEVVRSNMHRSRQTLRLFEIGSVFSAARGGQIREWDDVREEERLLIVQTGLRRPPAFDSGSPPADIFDLKGDVETLLKRLHLDKLRFIPYDARNTLTEQSISVEINGESAGWLGKVRSDIARQFDIDSAVMVCELAVQRLGDGLSVDRQYMEVPRYPAVQRDLAFVVAGSITHATLEGTIREAAGELLESVELFDTYAGEQVGAGSKSLAYSLVFRSRTGTLKDADVDAVIARIVEQAAAHHAAELRS